MKKPTTTTTHTHPSIITTTDGAPALSLAQCDTDNATVRGAKEIELEQRLNALASTAAMLGIDGLNYAVLRVNAIDKDLRCFRLGQVLQAKPPAGYCSVAEAVVMHKISERTIRRWITDGDLVPVRLGTRVFIELEKVRKLKTIK